MFKRPVACLLILTFLIYLIGPYKPVLAVEPVLGLPMPGTMLDLSSAYDPLLIKGLKIHPDNPLELDFIVDTGDHADYKKNYADPNLKTESQKLIKYFYAALTLPEKDVWVNLSPYEKDRIIPDVTGETVMGRDMLAQDYILKQITASLIYPEKGLGKEFWERIYTEAQQRFGRTKIPVNTFNKVWIVADKASVYEAKDTVLVVNAHLKVMLEEDYLSLAKHVDVGVKDPNINTIGSQIVREIVLPALEKEVNEGKNFANLRQIFHSLILAKWYKETLKTALLNQVYSNKNKVSGVDVQDKAIKEKIYQQYLEAYKKGVFNYIKDDINQTSKESTPRKYFSGGVVGAVHLDKATAAMASASLAGCSFLDVSSKAMMFSAPVKDISAAMVTKAEFKEFLNPRKIGTGPERQSVLKLLDTYVRSTEGPAVANVFIFPTQTSINNAKADVLFEKFLQKFYANPQSFAEFPAIPGTYLPFVSRVKDSIYGFLTMRLIESKIAELNDSIVNPKERLRAYLQMLKSFSPSLKLFYRTTYQMITVLSETRMIVESDLKAQDVKTKSIPEGSLDALLQMDQRTFRQKSQLEEQYWIYMFKALENVLFTSAAMTNAHGANGAVFLEAGGALAEKAFEGFADGKETVDLDMLGSSYQMRGNAQSNGRIDISYGPSLSLAWKFELRQGAVQPFYISSKGQFFTGHPSDSVYVYMELVNEDGKNLILRKISNRTSQVFKISAKQSAAIVTGVADLVIALKEDNLMPRGAVRKSTEEISDILAQVDDVDYPSITSLIKAKRFKEALVLIETISNKVQVRWSGAILTRPQRMWVSFFMGVERRLFNAIPEYVRDPDHNWINAAAAIDNTEPIMDVLLLAREQNPDNKKIYDFDYSKVQTWALDYLEGKNILNALNNVRRVFNSRDPNAAQQFLDALWLTARWGQDERFLRELIRRHVQIKDLQWDFLSEDSKRMLLEHRDAVANDAKVLWDRWQAIFRPQRNISIKQKIYQIEQGSSSLSVTGDVRVALDKFFAVHYPNAGIQIQVNSHAGSRNNTLIRITARNLRMEEVYRLFEDMLTKYWTDVKEGRVHTGEAELGELNQLFFPYEARVQRKQGVLIFEILDAPDSVSTMFEESSLPEEASSAMLTQQRVADKAAIVEKDWHQGGIDLDGSKFDLNRVGSGVQIAFDPAMVQQFKLGNFKGFTPIITSIIPVVDIYQLLGLKESDENEKLAHV